MNGQEISRLGRMSEAARACIPMHLECTPPRICYRDGFIAQFFYYPVDREKMEAGEPAFVLEFEIPSGHPVYMERLKAKPAKIGSCQELTDSTVYMMQEAYLQRCTVITEGAADPKAMDELQNMWLMTLPFDVARWFVALRGREEEDEAQQQAASSQENEKQHKRETSSQAQEAEKKQDMIRRWKIKMAEAIRRGDDDAARKAREEINRIRR